MAREQKLEASRRHFDRWSRTYERDPASRWLKEVQGEALASLELTPSDVLLDVGCGTGAAVREAAPTVARAVGVDLSPAMVAQARAFADDLPNVEFREGEASGRLPFEDGEFTAILCTTAFHHFPEPERAVREMARVLAPGGRVAIGDPDSDVLIVKLADLVLRGVQRSHVGFQGVRRLERLLAQAGLESPRVRRVWSGTYAIVRADRRSPGATDSERG